MVKKLFKQTLLPILNIDSVVMLVISMICIWFNLIAGLICFAITILTRLFHLYISEKNAKKKFASIQDDIEQEAEDMSKAFSQAAPLLICMVDSEGMLLWANDNFAEVFTSQDAFNEAAGSSFVNIFFDQEEAVEEIVVGDKIYSVSSKAVPRHDGSVARMLFWQNITSRETIKQMYQDSRSVIACIQVDNYDELISSAPSDERSTIAADIDVGIRSWAGNLHAAITTQRDGRYVMIFEYKYLDEICQSKFPILNKMHEIETKADFPTSVSIGISCGEATLEDLIASASSALELAQARGGDQAVVKKKGIEALYYGGSLPTVEKRNKGRSRIISHQLANAIESSENVIIAGHTNPDLDSLGAAAGIFALVSALNVPVEIVMSQPPEAIDVAFDHAVKSGKIKFVTHEQALEDATRSTLLVLVDHHIAAMSECPQLVDKVKRKVIIDHHRKSENAIEGAILSHMEVYASSTCELVTELLQYSSSKARISKLVAELMLSGIIVDTKNFTVNAGVRTFDAASWLRSMGTDPVTVKSFFSMRLDLYQKKANIIASAEILSNGVAVAYTKERDPAMQMLCAQAADELLDMKGVLASFVAGNTGTMTSISARSLGKVNVQVIMEKLGGGGHQNVAAAQLQLSPEEAISEVVKIMRRDELL